MKVTWDKKERLLWLSYLKFWKSITGVTASVFGVSPLALAVLEFAPPAPTWIPALPPLITLLLIVVLFFGREWFTETCIRRWVKILIVTAIVSLFLYIGAYMEWTAKADGNRHVTGFTLTKEATEAVRWNRVPSAAPRDLLNHFGHLSEDRIWKWRGTVHVVLAFLFCTPSVCSASALALLMVRNFMAFQATTTSSPKSKKSGATMAEVRS